ncbi:hypothetical protein M513_10889 [Trichuris suis]|nr:hypothetical protein M513_10889 [Trichuris suis]
MSSSANEELLRLGGKRRSLAEVTGRAVNAGYNKSEGNSLGDSTFLGKYYWRRTSGDSISQRLVYLRTLGRRMSLTASRLPQEKEVLKNCYRICIIDYRDYLVQFSLHNNELLLYSKIKDFITVFSNFMILKDGK